MVSLLRRSTGDPELDRLTGEIVDAAYVVQKFLGIGLLERTYRIATAIELESRGIKCEQEAPVAVRYRGRVIEKAYFIDLLVEDRIAVELKAVEAFHPSHSAQVLTCMRWADLRIGFVINFHASPFGAGVRRFVRDLPESSASSAESSA